MLSKSTTAQFTQLEEFWSTVGKFMLGGGCDLKVVSWFV